MFTRLGLISLIFSRCTLATSNQVPVVRLDNAVGYDFYYLRLADPDTLCNSIGLHWFDKRELDQFFGHPFRKTTVRITYVSPFSSRPDSISVREKGDSTFLNLAIRTTERST